MLPLIERTVQVDGTSRRYPPILILAAAMILVAVNLDPFHVRDVTIELPLWEFELADSAAVAAADLMRETSFTWSGKLQRVRLDPAELPFSIWRIAPRGA